MLLFYNGMYSYSTVEYAHILQYLNIWLEKGKYSIAGKILENSLLEKSLKI